MALPALPLIDEAFFIGGFMSNIGLHWARKTKTGDPKKKLVMFIIGDNMNEDGCAVIDVTDIASDYDFTIKEMCSVIRELRDLDIIELRRDGRDDIDDFDGVFWIIVKGV